MGRSHYKAIVSVLDNKPAAASYSDD